MIEARTSIPDYVSERLPLQAWQTRRQAHKAALSAVMDPYLKKKQHQHKDPVLDFLFEYYAFRPSHLLRWSPGLGVLLEGAGRESAPAVSELAITGEGAFLDPARFPDNRRSSARWILTLLQNSLENEPAFGCFGMHEWAMVYRADTIRHNRLPLRMPPDELADFVESRPLACTHFDAFRFFTEPARPMNRFELSRENFSETEQAGCLHTNMDLYKWAFKMFPWIASDIIRTAFLLAVDARIIDMKASPYDLREHGLEPIKIETKEGRKEYMKRQKAIYRRSVPVRKDLIEAYRQLIDTF